MAAIAKGPDGIYYRSEKGCCAGNCGNAVTHYVWVTDAMRRAYCPAHAEQRSCEHRKAKYALVPFRDDESSSW